MFFLGHDSPRTRHDGQLSHWDGGTAIFSCFFLMSLPLLSMQEIRLLRRAGRERSQPHTDGQTDRHTAAHVPLAR